MRGFQRRAWCQKSVFHSRNNKSTDALSIIDDASKERTIHEAAFIDRIFRLHPLARANSGRVGDAGRKP
jgi:hypothetical protein